jgi:hypothetical protein
MYQLPSHVAKEGKHHSNNYSGHSHQHPLSQEKALSRMDHHHKERGEQKRRQNINALDYMFAAKLAPGDLNPPYFVNDEEITPLKMSLVSKAKQWAQCFDADSDPHAFVPFGTRRYLVIAYCPVLSLFYYPGS